MSRGRARVSRSPRNSARREDSLRHSGMARRARPGIHNPCGNLKYRIGVLRHRERGGYGFRARSRPGMTTDSYPPRRFSERSYRRSNTPHHSISCGGDRMQRRDFLKFAVGIAAGATALAASANAAPLSPVSPAVGLVPGDRGIEPAVVSQDEVDHLKPEQVRWHHHGHRRWGHHWHRHWGWRRRHWGWHRHHWRRHRW